MRLVVVSDLKGVPVGYDLVGPKTGAEREAVIELACGHPESVLCCDKDGFGDASFRARSSSSTSSSSPPNATEKARIRLVIESVFSNLKRQVRLTDHLAKTVGGLAQRIAQRLLALTVGMFCNLLAGRPAKALVAYDGR